jgi:hypothetical protein
MEERCCWSKEEFGAKKSLAQRRVWRKEEFGRMIVKMNFLRDKWTEQMNEPVKY